MKFYIIDDNLATVKTLENIIKTRDLGMIYGSSTNPRTAIAEITEEPVDIVLVDLLMDDIDGITLVKTIREQNNRTMFVMISKATDKELIQRAYTAGIEFFINKPVNIIEVERVLANVAERIKMRDIMGSIRQMFDDTPGRKAGENRTSAGNEADILLGSLGMLGEKGTQDIRAILGVMQARGSSYDKDVLRQAADETGDTVKNIEQRVRRAIKKGLSNAAAAGLDNYDSETFTVYAGYVFDFKTLKEEMNYLDGRSSAGGRVNIARFFEGLMLYCHSS